jgi:hypothetical protein
MNIKDVPFRNLVLMIVNGLFGDSFDSIADACEELIKEMH